MIDDWLIIANKDIGLLSFKLEWFNLPVMRFLQDVISNRWRQRDWTNPWPLICSGSRRPVIPAMVSPPISALFPVVSTEKPESPPWRKKSSVSFLADRWTCENANSCGNIHSASVITISALFNHRWATTRIQAGSGWEYPPPRDFSPEA